MGFGASLTFIAIGAILAFALQVDLSGINIHMVGWILILVGIASMIFTFVYTRPRRRAATAELADEEPVYLVHPEEAAAPDGSPVTERPVEPHVHTDVDGHPNPAAPATPVTPASPAAPSARPLRQTTEQAPGNHVHEPAPQPGRHFEEGLTHRREPL